MGDSINPATQRPREPLELAMSATLLALSLVLHIFKLPYPPAPFLKFDGVGIPLAVLALYSLRASVAVTPLVLAGLMLMGADIIGATMKVIAELATFLPLAFLYRRSRGAGGATVVAVASRVSSMVAFNLIVAPYWLSLTYGWSYEKSFEAAIALLPHIAVFNAIAASYVSAIGLSAFNVVSRVLGVSRGTR